MQEGRSRSDGVGGVPQLCQLPAGFVLEDLAVILCFSLPCVILFTDTALASPA